MAIDTRLPEEKAFDEGIAILYALTGEEKDGLYTSASEWAETVDADVTRDGIDSFDAMFEARGKEVREFRGVRFVEYDAAKDWVNDDSIEYPRDNRRPMLVVDLGEYRVYARDCSREA